MPRSRRRAIWETENGPDRDDEVNRLRGGANYGWPEVTGDDGPGGFEDPVAVFGRTVALTGCVWIGGTLVVGSFNDDVVRTIDPATGEAATVATFDAGVTDLQLGPDGLLYVATARSIWRLDLSATEPGPSAPPDGARPDRGWLAIGAAILLALALVWRVRAGRGLRSSDA